MKLCDTVDEFERWEEECRRDRAIELIGKGVDAAAIAERLGISRCYVRRLKKRTVDGCGR